MQPGEAEIDAAKYVEELEAKVNESVESKESFREMKQKQEENVVPVVHDDDGDNEQKNKDTTVNQITEDPKP